MPTRPPIFRPPGWSPAPRKRPQIQDRFYGTQEWRKLREVCVARDGFRCTATDCTTLHRGHGGRLIVDHIVERRLGGPDQPSNLRTLCPACDNRRHGRRGKGGSKV
jgi:5-methylcytosine-specific restriction endonuclease McrA